MEKLQQNLDVTTQHSKQVLKQAIAVAFDRTGTTPPEINVIDAMVEDIFSEFPKLDELQIKKALRNGGLGMYGKTFKLTTQELCIWIRQYIKDSTWTPPHPTVIDN